MRAFYLCALAIGLCMISFGAYRLRRDRASLQWPTVPGTIMQVDVSFHGGRNGGGYILQATYTYIVNGIRHVSQQISLWNANLSGYKDSKSFAKAHPVRSSMDVYYDPKNPANAVLIPGADEFGCRIAIWGGSVTVILAAFGLLLPRKEYAQLSAQCRVEDSKSRPSTSAGVEEAKSPGSSGPFLGYAPHYERKLSFFPDKECLLESLGHGDEKIQDWEPNDRVVDSSGRLFRLVRFAKQKRYDLELTGETWDWQKILALAVADAAIIKRDPNGIRNRAEQAPDGEKISVIMRCVDELPAAPCWMLIGLGLFLLLFFLAVVFATYHVITWLHS